MQNELNPSIQHGAFNAAAQAVEQGNQNNQEGPRVASKSQGQIQLFSDEAIIMSISE